MFIGIFNEKKQEVKMLPTTEMISVVQKVDCYEPTVVETSEVFSLFFNEKYCDWCAIVCYHTFTNQIQFFTNLHRLEH